MLCQNGHITSKKHTIFFLIAVFISCAHSGNLFTVAALTSWVLVVVELLVEETRDNVARCFISINMSNMEQKHSLKNDMKNDRKYDIKIMT